MLDANPPVPLACGTSSHSDSEDLPEVTKHLQNGSSKGISTLEAILNLKFHAANVPKISLEFNTVRRARGKEFCSHSLIQGIKL